MIIPESQHPIDLDAIEQALNNHDCHVRQAALLLCRGSGIPLATLERWLTAESDPEVKKSIAETCWGRHLTDQELTSWLAHPNTYVQLAALTSCRGRPDFPFDLIHHAFSNVENSKNVPGDIENDTDIIFQELSNILCSEYLQPFPIIKDWLPTHPLRKYSTTQKAAIQTAYLRRDATPEILQQALVNDQPINPLIALLIEDYHPHFPDDIIIQWLNHPNKNLRLVAVALLQNHPDIPLSYRTAALSDPDNDIAQLAVMSCKGIPIAEETLLQWVRLPDQNMRRAALQSCHRSDAPAEVISIGLSDESSNTRILARSAANHLPSEILSRWTDYPDTNTRIAAFNVLLCRIKDEVAKTALLDKMSKDPSEYIKRLATSYLASQTTQANGNNQ